MPMTWNAEADAKLLNAIIKVYDVKVTGEKMKDVAEIMGPECTAKAITHRLAKLRNVMTGTGGGNGENEAQEDGATTAKGKATKANKATASKGKATKGKKAAAERTPTPSEEGEEGMITPPDTTTKKRAGLKRKSTSAEAQDDAESQNKKIKLEEGEIDEGGAHATGEVEEGGA